MIIMARDDDVCLVACIIKRLTSHKSHESQVSREQEDRTIVAGLLA